MSKTQSKRLLREMEQFDDPSLKDTILKVTHLEENSVSVHMPDGSVWRVTRDLDFIRPPKLLRYSMFVETCDEEYSPAFTSVKWLLMVYFQGRY